MGGEIEIRQADFSRLEDRSAFLKLLQYYAQTPLGAAGRLAAEVESVLVDRWQVHPGAFSLIAWQAGLGVGLANCLTSFSTFRAQPRINIHDLVVLAAFEGQGVGRCLIDAVVQEAHQRGACQITLEVREDNVRAHGLYQRYGFQGLEGGHRVFFGTLPIADS